MKPLLWFVLLFAPLAHASTVIYLVPPTPPLSDVHTTSCSAAVFSADGTRLMGICQYTYGPTCGRYCLLAAEDYAVSWDLSGQPTLGMWCSSTTAGLVKHRTTTQNSAYSGLPCIVHYQTDTVIEVNGAPYWYAGANNVGDILVCNSYGCDVELSS